MSIVRRFLVHGHKAIASSQFNLNDLAGSAGRLDVLVRCVNSSLLLSHGLRENVELTMVLAGGEAEPVSVTFNGDRIRYVNPDERSTAALVRHGLIKLGGGDGPVEATPGIVTERKGLEDWLDEHPIVLLDEKGDDILQNISATEGAVSLEPLTKLFEDSPLILLSDHNEWEEKEMEAILARDPRLISLGPSSYHSHSCISILQWMLDRAGI